MTTGFFEVSPGNKSTGRLMSFMFSVYAIIAASYVFVSTKDYVAGIAVFTAISGVALGQKLGQKQMEYTNGINNNTNNNSNNELIKP